MNDLFVNIKVDREERPDLDKIYQTAHQLYTGRPGGWPLTVFLTPEEHLPIFTGTYFPKERRYGMPAFREVLAGGRVLLPHAGRRDPRRGAGLVEALDEIDTGSGDDFATLTRAPLERARQRLAQSFDREHGGFGDAPKFPHATYLELLLAQLAAHRAQAATPTSGARAIVTHTLDRMADGGLYDQLGGGFYRYSVDRDWAIPHFEKMLYDNAALLAVYADAYRRDRRAALCARRRRDGRLGRSATCRTRAAASTRRSMRIPSTRKASSTCGRRRSSTRCLTADESRLARSACSGSRPTAAGAELRGFALASARGRERRRGGGGARRRHEPGRDALFETARAQAARGPRAAGVAGPRREDPACRGTAS